MNKKEAVSELIDGSIHALNDNHEAIAITLSGAAECAMPEPSISHLYSVTRDSFIGYTESDGTTLSRTDVVSRLNRQRDWLKHYNERQPLEMELTDGYMSVMRAISKFQQLYGHEAETPTMIEFFSVARAYDPEDG